MVRHAQLDAMRYSKPIHPTGNLAVAREPGEVFHTWCLPSLWSIGVLAMWFVVWFQQVRGEQALITAVVGFVGTWLPMTLGLHGTVAIILTQLFGGILVMGLVGLLQDSVHVSKQIVVLYLIAPLASFAYLTVMRGKLDPHEFIARLLLVHFCFDLYILSVASFVVYFLLFIWRKLLGRNRDDDLC